MERVTRIEPALSAWEITAGIAGLLAGTLTGNGGVGVPVSYRESVIGCPNGHAAGMSLNLGQLVRRLPAPRRIAIGYAENATERDAS